VLCALVGGFIGLALTSSGGGTPSSTAATSPSSDSTTTRAIPTAARLPPIIYRPPAVQQASVGRLPLLIVLQGSDGSPSAMVSLTGMDQVAAQHGFVAAYLATATPAHPWSTTADLAYISSMIDQLVATENVDPRRVYVTGFSAGGYASWQAGCRLSQKVAAIAIVENAMNGTLYASCSPLRPISELLIIGTGVPILYSGVPGRLPSAYETTARWRELDGCSSRPSQSSQAGPIDTWTWSSCTDHSSVGLDVIQGGAHTWPGPPASGPDSQLDASEAVWSFVSGHTAPSLTTVPARLLSLSTKTASRSRMLYATLWLGEPLNMKLTLRAGRRSLISRTYQLPRNARTQLNLTVPRAAKAGRYSVGLTLVDSYGRRLALASTIRLPKPQRG
jgi:polyhydroxybutyrate depolymerase